MNRYNIELFIILLLPVWVTLVSTLPERKLSDVSVGVVMPIELDIFSHGGDTYLAANLSFLKTLVYPPEGDVISLNYRAELHKRVSLLNPKHENNYYIATSSLPWEGSVFDAQFVLEKSIEARPFDSMPSFFYGLNALYFETNVSKALMNIRRAADIEQGPNKPFMKSLTSFIEKNEFNENLPLAYLRLIKGVVTSPVLYRQIESREKKLETVIEVKKAIINYKKKFGERPDSLEAIAEAGLLNREVGQYATMVSVGIIDGSVEYDLD